MERTIPEHRIQCSHRILIGPLDGNSPLPFRISQNSRPEPGSSQNKTSRHSEAMHDTDNISPILSAAKHDDTETTQHDYASYRNFTNTNSQNLHASTTDSTAAQWTTSNDTTGNDYNNGIDDTEHHTFLSQLETLDPASIASSKFSLSTNLKSASLSTIPTDTGAKNSKPSNTSPISHDGRLSTMNTSHLQRQIPPGDNKSKYDSHQTPNRTVLWRKSGPVFVPPLPNHTNKSDDSNYANTVIKHDALLCNRLIYNCNGKQPSAYKQSHTHSTSSKRQEDWQQLEMILTPGALKCYTSSGLVWPKRTVKYHILLDDEKDSNLLLYLLSPLDYTFCLQYTPRHEKDGITLVFRARSLTLSQEWYMAIYQILPDHARKPTPHECKIYIPPINIHVHIPLIKLHPSQLDDQQNHDRYDSRYFITMDHVKEAIMDLLEKDSDWQAALGNELDRTDLSLCWIRDGRAEWILWKNSVGGNQDIDMVLCPQSIENTHQLELRPVQHTPHTIVLAEGTKLEEPHPCEGFLTMVTGFEGQHIKTGTWAPQRFYFASFDGFLFVIPEDKTIPPHTHTYVDPKTRKHDKKSGLQPSSTAGDEFNNPFVTLVTPFTDDDNSNIVYGWKQDELDRRMKLIAGAIGCINLTEVSFVRRSSDIHPTTDTPHTGSAQNYENGCYGSISSDLVVESLTSPLTQDNTSSSSSHLLGGHHHWDKQQSCVELVMENGIIIKLKAYSSETCDRWVLGLSDLVLYAKARSEAYRDIHGNNDNKNSLSNDSVNWMCEKCDIGSTTCGSSVCHRMTSSINHSSVDTRIWSLCLFTQCRDITKSGLLYVQSKGVFSQKQFILTADGRLHYFNVYKRSGDDGQPIQTGIHERKGTLDMANAYIYSGMMSSFDNESSQTQLDRPPRFFDNGIATNDSDEDCLFTIWIPQRRRIFSPRRQSIITYGADRRFNSSGQRWLFMAPNKQDKEEWVWAISILQEELLREATK